MCFLRISVISVYISVLVRPSGPTAILSLCDFLPRTFGLNGFLPFSVHENINGDSTPIGLMAI